MADQFTRIRLPLPCHTGRKFANLLLFGTCCLAIAAARITSAVAEEFQIAIASDAGQLEQIGAQELSDQLTRLYAAKVTIGTQIVPGNGKLILLFSQSQQSAFQGLTVVLPRLEIQDHALKSGKLGDRSVLVLAGGSPQAALWAVYELGWQLGIRYFPFGDLYPAAPDELRVTGHDHLLEPNVARRTWYALTPTLAGSQAWGAEEFQRTVRQLAKLKYTDIVVDAAALKNSLASSSGIVVSGDTVGRSVFSGAKMFDNPAWINAKNSGERYAALGILSGQIIAEASRFGIAADRSTDGSSDPSRLKQLEKLSPVWVLPQMRQSDLLTPKAEGKSEQIVSFGNPNDAAPEILLLARSAFNSRITQAEHEADLLDPVCGQGVSQRVVKAFEYCEAATKMLDDYDPQLASPEDGLFAEQFTSSDPVPAWWGQVRDLYLNAMNEMYRANTRAREGGRQYTLYFARRFEFGFEYMNAIEAVRKAGQAKLAGKVDEQAAELEKALDSITGACNAMAAVARSNSDRGIIALMNQHAYRPVQKLLDEL